jgi:hypothetical protein
MYSNEKKAVGAAIGALALGLRGENFDAAIVVEGGKEYDDTRELCAKIIAAAVAAKELAGRVAALEAA